jgi:hypothetical protein
VKRSTNQVPSQPRATTTIGMMTRDPEKDDESILVTASTLSNVVSGRQYTW